MSEERKEIGYYHTSNKQVVPGYSNLYHTLSSVDKDMDENGNVGFIENIGGQMRNMIVNLKGQRMLDFERRGGERLWQRIYTEEDMVAKMEEIGIQVRPKTEGEVKAESKKETDPKESESVTGGDDEEDAF